MNTATNLLANKSVRIMIVDDHPTVCEGLRHRIEAQPDMTVAGEAADMDEALQQLGESSPHLVVVDIALRTSNGLDLVKTIASRQPQVRTLVHSMYDENIYADRCLRAGAKGYVNKESDPKEVIRAIREIVAGNLYLSPQMTNRMLGRRFNPKSDAVDPVESLTDRQLEIFRLIGEGEGARAIADRLHISVHTVETHRENIKRKLNIERLSDLNRRAVLWVQENA
jgi:DNA-binding NarL/FixJ family response regulator